MSKTTKVTRGKEQEDIYWGRISFRFLRASISSWSMAWNRNEILKWNKEGKGKQGSAHCKLDSDQFNDMHGHDSQQPIVA